ncbi:MAG: hypothetical protein ACOCQD_02310 [archaeon]
MKLSDIANKHNVIKFRDGTYAYIDDVEVDEEDDVTLLYTTQSNNTEALFFTQHGECYGVRERDIVKIYPFNTPPIIGDKLQRMKQIKLRPDSYVGIERFKNKAGDSDEEM